MSAWTDARAAAHREQLRHADDHDALMRALIVEQFGYLTPEWRNARDEDVPVALRLVHDERGAA
jgi:hypothetical protein